MAGFIFGGNTGETPESLKRKRSIAEALAVKTSSAPKNVGEGLNAIGNALIYRALMGKVDAGEAAGKKTAADDAAALMSGFGSPASTSAPASGGIPMTDAAGEVSATSPKVAASGSGNIYEDFIGGVKSAGLTNPYGLAAVAATGQAESGWSPQNANRSWSDPSQSGKAGTAGGVMSWRNERLNNLYNFARQRGEEPGSISPATQAAFFVQEDPSLIQRLNSAKSAEEAQRLMNNAWKFAGYDQPGGETARRMGLASSYVPRFQGGNTEVASLDPSAGMSAADAIEAVAPQSGGYRDPMVSAPNSRGAVANALMAPAPQAAQPSPVVAALASPQASPASASDALPVSEMASTTNAAVAPRNQTVAQALSGAPRQPEAPQYYPAAPTPAGQSGPSLQQIMQVINNPYSSEGSRAYAQSLLEQRQKQSDPSYQLEQEYKRAQLEALRGKPVDTWDKLDDGTLYRKSTGEIKRVGGEAAGNGQFRFKGNAVDAQALNGLMDAGKLTPDQAQQIAAGKTVTGPNGEIIFMTPQGVFGQSADGTLSPMSAPQPPQPPAAPQAPANGVDIFGAEATAAAPQPPAPPQAPQPPAAPQREGMIPLTAPKPDKPTEAQRNRVGNVNQAFDAITGELDRYADLVDKTGIEAMPGKDKDNLNTVRQGVMLQMKELFNLGVLNGPDLSLMEKMIYDPVIDPMKEGGLTNIPGQIWASATGTAGERAKNSVTELKRMLENIKNSVGNNSGPIGRAAPAGGADYKNRYGLE